MSSWDPKKNAIIEQTYFCIYIGANFAIFTPGVNILRSSPYQSLVVLPIITWIIFAGLSKIISSDFELYVGSKHQPISSRLSRNITSLLSSVILFTKHINEKVAKASKGIGIIRLLSSHVPLDALDQLYKLFAWPHLDYCDIIYHVPVITYPLKVLNIKQLSQFWSLERF